MRLARERIPTLAALLTVAVSAAATVGAMRRTSITFDETFMIPSGAYGYQTGKFDVIQHPPVMQYVYGLPVFLAHPRFPPGYGETPGHGPEMGPWPRGAEFFFGQLFLWRMGNDPEALAFRARLMAVAVAAGLALTTFVIARRRWGAGAALIAAWLVAFLPDTLAHGGVAYNDVPSALAMFAAAFVIDRAVRDHISTYSIAIRVIDTTSWLTLSIDTYF